MFRTEGFSSLYRGVLIYWASTTVSNVSFFGMYAFLKKKERYEEHPSNLWAFFISTQASIFTATVTHPFWTLKTRLILHLRLSKTVDRNGFIIFKKVLLDLLKNEGALAFYKGYITSLCLCTTGIVHMTCYEFMKRITGKLFSQQKYVNDALPLLNGAFSRLIATSLMYPLTTVRTRLQKKQYTLQDLTKVAPEKGEILYKGNIDCFKKIVRNEGLRGFYKGLVPNLFRVVPANGIFFFIYEHVNKFLTL
eukprot:TRINITY_DN5030_c0_g1_i2.p1 TRINITY_DN5030_c0_g1~~TRINITY_DN5030_c0_g1_i2.p1  ORF type:complete len:250 (-),score=54.14 TRINITY_DN5030_c0_g1_i2:132-881(-)